MNEHEETHTDGDVKTDDNQSHYCRVRVEIFQKRVLFHRFDDCTYLFFEIVVLCVDEDGGQGLRTADDEVSVLVSVGASSSFRFVSFF